MENERRSRVLVPVSLAKDIRISKGLSQSEAAHRLGVSASLISLIESGQRPPAVFCDYLRILAEAPNKKHRTPGGEQRVGRAIRV